MNKFKNSDQLVLSYELLQLLEWLVEHEAESVKKIIKRALGKGLVKKFRTAENLNATELQYAVVEYLELLEVLLFEARQELETSDVMRKNLLPSLDQIDTSTLNSATIQSSAAIAAIRKEKNPEENAEDVLFKEILKRWKPKKKLSH